MRIRRDSPSASTSTSATSVPSTRPAAARSGSSCARCSGTGAKNHSNRRTGRLGMRSFDRRRTFAACMRVHEGGFWGVNTRNTTPTRTTTLLPYCTYIDFETGLSSFLHNATSQRPVSATRVGRDDRESSLAITTGVPAWQKLSQSLGVCHALAAMITKRFLPALRSSNATPPHTRVPGIASAFLRVSSNSAVSSTASRVGGRAQWYTQMVFLDTRGKLCIASTGLLSPSRMVLPTAVAQKRM